MEIRVMAEIGTIFNTGKRAAQKDNTEKLNTLFFRHFHAKMLKKATQAKPAKTRQFK
jgi:hypothetical protein